MADAKIINYGQQISAGSTAIPDNTTVALDIESTDGANYVTINTTDGGSEELVLRGGGSAGVKITQNNQVRSTVGDGWVFLTSDPTGTVPNICPSQHDLNTGIGHGAGGNSDSDQLSLIAGGVEGIRITEDTTILAEIKGRTVITADTSGTPDDLGDFDNYALVLQGSSNTNDETALLLSGSSNTYGGSAVVHKDTGAGGKGELSFYTKQSTAAEPPVKAMTLGDDGQVGIGTDAPNYKLTVTSALTNEDVFGIRGTGSTAVRLEHYSNMGAISVYGGGGVMQHNINARSGSNGQVVFNELGYDCDFRVEGDTKDHMIFSDASADMIGIGESTPSKMLDVYNGASGGDILCYDIYTHDGAVETSDERLKENIVETPLGLDFINSLNPVAYKWKDTDEVKQTYTVKETREGPEHEAEQIYPAVTYSRMHHGLIAQQVETAIEAAGLTSNDFAGFCYEEERDEYRLRYSQFIAPLIKSVQELTARVAELEAGD